MDLSVVIMAFNEEKSLELVVSEIENVLDEINCQSEIIIIDDGSTDNTYQISDFLADKYKRVRVIHHKKNKGLGGVYRTGFDSAKGELLTFYPADGQFSGSLIKLLLSRVVKSDMVLGYLINQKRSFLSMVLSKAERILYNLLYGKMPKFQGILMFRRRLLEEIKLKSSGRGWAVLMEFIIKAQRNGFRINSVPIDIRPRFSGKSKVNNFKTIFANLKQAVILRGYLR
ncbi:glycosyltransferase family 2 protein [bacterium]|nr:glycosyltransferase family 2 protein [bacterium]